jgi:hypothetical protein
MTSTIIENIKMRSIKGKSQLVSINFKKGSISETNRRTFFTVLIVVVVVVVVV